MPEYSPPSDYGTPEPVRIIPDETPLSYRPILSEEMGSVLVEYLKYVFSDTRFLFNPYLDYLVTGTENNRVMIVYGLDEDRTEHSPKIVVTPFPYKPGVNIPTIGDANIGVKMQGKQKSQANFNLLQGTCQCLIHSDSRSQARSIQSELQLLLFRDYGYLTDELNIKGFNLSNDDPEINEEKGGSGRSQIPGSDFVFSTSIVWTVYLSSEMWTERTF